MADEEITVEHAAVPAITMPAPLRYIRGASLKTVVFFAHDAASCPVPHWSTTARADMPNPTPQEQRPKCAVLHSPPTLRPFTLLTVYLIERLEGVCFSNWTFRTGPFSNWSLDHFSCIIHDHVLSALHKRR